MASIANDRSDGGLIVVLGATGGLGGALVRELVTRGKPVRGVARRMPDVGVDGVEFRAADAESGEGLASACAGAGVVVDALNPPYAEWPERFPAMNRAVIGVAEEQGARLVFVDNLYAYGPHDGPLTEDLARAATSTKGRVRILLEQELMAAHEAGRVRVAIGRLSDYYGPHGPGSVIPALILGPAVAGKTMRWPGSLDQPHTLHFLPDAARGLATLVLDDRADGAVWHLPAARAPTGREFTVLVNDALERPVKVRPLGAAMMRIGGLFSKDAREMVELSYQWTAPFVSDATRFEATFGPVQTTAHAEAVALTLAAMRREHAA
ncbi:MAG TPA: NAD-dependent epimerase/dehydratase family protein [Solirubrobacteraceae bacterium]